MGHYSLWLAALRLFSAFAVGTILNIGRKREMYSKEKKITHRSNETSPSMYASQEDWPYHRLITQKVKNLNKHSKTGLFSLCYCALGAR